MQEILLENQQVSYTCIIFLNQTQLEIYDLVFPIFDQFPQINIFQQTRKPLKIISLQISQIPTTIPVSELQQSMFDFFFEPVGIKRCGCYAVSPLLVGVQQQQNILVPLRSCNYHLEIVNAMVNVTLLQTYQNPTNKFLEVEYAFPVAPNACVYRFIAEFGGHRMEGVVKEKQFARMEYQEAVKEGKKAAYGEKNTKEDDMLTLKIGNIGPKQQVTIEIQYLHELSLSFNTFYQLKVPASLAPRFLNILPKNIISSGYRPYGTPKVAEEGFTWSFQITIRTTRKITFFSSSSHKIDMVKQNDTHTESILSIYETSPTKEFVFSYTTENHQLPSCVFGRSDKSSTAMLSFVPKFCTMSLSDAYKASVQGKPLQGEIDSSKGEYIFLLDRSGSMKGSKIEKAKEALILFIKSLPKDSYFNVISFGSKSQRVFNESRPYKNHFIEDALGQVKEMTANLGGTNIYNPLSQLLKDKKKEGYPKHVFLLTDGEVSDTQSIFQMIGRNNKYARVHSIGVGHGASEELIKGCAKNGKGAYVFIGDNEDPSEKIIQLLADSLSPMIDSISLDFDESIVESIIPNPKSLPYFLKGQIVNFYVTFKGQLTQQAHFSFSYKDSKNQLPYSAEITIDPEMPSQPFIDRMGHFKNIKVLEESLANEGDIEECMYFVKKIDKKEEIISQSVEHQILSDFTAFVCVQKELIDGKLQQINDTGKVKVIIINPPVQRPAPQRDQFFFNSEKFIGSASMPSIKQMARKRRSDMIGCYRAMDQKIGSGIDRAENSNLVQQQSSKIENKKAQEEKGIMAGIASFFKDMFGKKDESQRQQGVNQNTNMAKKQKQRERIIQQPIINEKKVVSVSTEMIKRLIEEQDSDGYWKNLSLIDELFGPKVGKIAKQQQNPLAAATFLIAFWIEKHHPQKQYSLIVKKAYAYASKDTANYQQFPVVFHQYIQ